MYPVIEVTSEMRNAVEQLGSKPKFWFKYNGENWLFKEARKDSGEDWSEKVASEIAQRLGLPTHHAELAVWEGKRGCAVKSFLTNRSILVHGNELLGGFFEGYDKTKERGQSAHTFDNIVAAIRDFFLTEETRHDGASQLVGYILLDALVGNTDRHHQNWGILLRPEFFPDKPYTVTAEIAPTFDHASSLGRELTDETRERVMREGQIVRYIRNGKGGIFDSADSAKGMCPMAVVELVALRYPELFKEWQLRLSSLPENFWEDIGNCIPETRISDAGRRFVNTMLSTSRKMIEQIP